MSSTRDDRAVNQVGLSTEENGPYTLRSILTAEQLHQDGLKGSTTVTCVEFWDDHLYIGTSGAEILHYVRLPAPEDDTDAEATFTCALNLPVPYSTNAEINSKEPGIKQIFIIPLQNKACVLCNGSISFYSLPELTPIFETASLNNCTWVGGADLNDQPGQSGENGTTIIICQKNALRLVTIGERPRAVNKVELGGCIETIRRGNIACVADADSYSLLDIVGRQRIPLAEISTVDPSSNIESASSVAGDVSGEDAPENPKDERSPQRSPEPGHERSSSTGTVENTTNRQRQLSSSRRAASQQLDPNSANFPPRGSSLSARSSPSRSPQRPKPIVEKLRPHVISPSEAEFMFTTGTSYDERGVAMFVNMDGDPVRGTLEFSRYPLSVCVDSKGSEFLPSETSDENNDEGYILALINQSSGATNQKMLEIRSWDAGSTQSTMTAHQLLIPNTNREHTSGEFNGWNYAGLRVTSTDCEVKMLEIVDLLAPSQLELQLSGSEDIAEPTSDVLAQAMQREASEKKFISSLSFTRGRVMLWDTNNIWWVVRNPEVISLNASLLKASDFAQRKSGDWINRNLVESTLNEIRGREPSNILETLSLRDVRQKGSIILFMDTVHQTLSNIMTYERDRRATEDALIEADVDPRILLSLIPVLREEIVQGPNGIWVANGLKQLVQGFLASHDLKTSINPSEPSGEAILHLIKRYLIFWRRKKGDASITDEHEVFLSVDAAVLHILLILDSRSPRGPGRKPSVRAELNAVVDHGIECFDRAVNLLEGYKRLYVLSRLYQSRKMSGQVLGTWRRIIEGEPDAGGELADGESEVQKYLTKIHDPKLLEEYGAWLANRNPNLGVRVFSDPNSKIKVAPERAVEILKREAPSAVKVFLEHLVFDNHLEAYADDLITYYLDSVVTELESSQEAKSILLKSYEDYRALRSPKPTYSQFAENLGVEAEWWHNRLRLLQLLGGSHGAASKYDVDGMFSRIALYEKELTPEMIVLNGRQGKHRQAITLLTHGLGDFDTAIRYCVLGGSSTYSPLTGSLPVESEPSRSQQEELFGQLIEEFLKIEDVGERGTQTSALLERFGGWFDPIKVLDIIPNDWSVRRISSFLESAVRTLVTERHEALMTKALASTDSLNANFELIEKTEWHRPRLDQVT